MENVVIYMFHYLMWQSSFEQVVATVILYPPTILYP